MISLSANNAPNTEEFQYIITYSCIPEYCFTIIPNKVNNKKKTSSIIRKVVPRVPVMVDCVCGGGGCHFCS